MNGQSWPTYRRPKWQESRISSLRQQFAAPQVGRLKRKMTGITAGMGYDPQSVQARRASIRGYGEGLGGIMAGAGHLALSQYGQEYGREFEAAKLDFGAELEKARAGWETEERRGREEFQRGEKRFEFDWRTGEREEEQTWRQRYDPSLLERARRRGGGGFAATPIGGRKQGGPVQPFAYSVGEGGRASKPKPELVVYRSGRMELVGKRGPEVRTFPEEGQVISAGKTKKILKNKGFSIVSRKRGGAVKQLEEKMGQSPLRANIMRFLKSTRMDPNGG